MWKKLEGEKEGEVVKWSMQHSIGLCEQQTDAAV